MTNSSVQYTEPHALAAGEVEWTITFINYRGQKYVVESDRNSVIAGFTIQEALFNSNVITGDVKILDTAALDERIPLIGHEKIIIEFNSTMIGSMSGIQPSKNEYTIVKRSATINDGPRSFYVLEFCSDEFIANLRNKVSQSWKAELASNIINDIYTKYIQKDRFVKNQKRLIYDKKGDADATWFGMHFVFPNIRPFQAIDMVVKRSVASNVQTQGDSKKANFGRFLFYENRFGFNFKSLSDLLHPQITQTPAEVGDMAVADVLASQGSDTGRLDENARIKGTKIESTPQSISTKPHVASYIIRPGDMIDPSDLENSFSVIQYKIESTFNVLNNLIEGMYSGRLLTYDPILQRIGTIQQQSSTPYVPADGQDPRLTSRLFKSNQRQDYYEYDYYKNFDEFRHVGGETGKMAPKQHYGVDASESFYRYVSTNFQHNEKAITSMLQNVMTENDISAISVDKQVERYLIQGYAQARQLKNIITQITVPGDQGRTVGEVIQLRLPSNYYRNEEHTFYSGMYLITKIMHTVNHNGSYVTVMELLKDTLFEGLKLDQESEDADELSGLTGGFDENLNTAFDYGKAV